MKKRSPSRSLLGRSALGLACLGVLSALAPGALSQPKPPPAPAPSVSVKAGVPGAPSAALSASAAVPGLAPPALSAGVSAPVAPPSAADNSTKKSAPPPPPPSAAQVAALHELEKEAASYEKQAKDYRSAITRIVQHHYEDRRRRILSALDAEITTEKKGLREAREEAIRRLEAFVEKYSGTNAHPENTPDAMFRLAALYEERARTDTDTSEDLAVGLKPAVALYKRVIREYPKYRELAGIYYYLGHAYNDSSRIPEAQQVWRSLVCQNTYAYPVPADPKDPDRDQVKPLPQDHDREYWNGWEARHPTPTRGGMRGAPPPRVVPRKVTKGKAGPTTSLEEESTYHSPYADNCVPIAQVTAPGAEPRYVAEVWWLIGDYHFNDVDQGGGAFNLNRAESAYQHAIKFKKPPVHGVAMYKLAWTYFKQQRYETSVHEFVDLLRYTDEQEKMTGDPGTDFRAEAYTYIAGSLTYLDFAGPGPDDPYIPRNDVLDIEQDPHVAEQKMHIAIDRVQDPKLIPQNEKWTVEIYKALAQEFKELNQYRNTIEVSELILRKWPMHRDAPVIQSQIADIYDTLAAQARDGTADRAQFSAKALEARTKLSNYVGTKPWVQANLNDPEAIQTAERLVRGGLRRAAADHTNTGNNLANQALGIADKESRDPIFERALSEYRLAAQGWAGYLAQDENSPDAYESRFWLADANHMIVVIQVATGHSPTAGEVEAARKTAIAVRDSNEDDKFLQPAAQFVVDTAQQVLNDQYNQFDRTKGASGFARRTEVPMTGEGDAKKVSKLAIPPQVTAAIAARDEYVSHVPPSLDTPNNAPLYAFDGAEFYFLYGNFDEAQKRYQPIYDRQCGKTSYAYKSWERLLTMSNLQNDAKRSRELTEAAEKRSCAVTAEDKVAGDILRKQVLGKVYYQEAYASFEKAEKMQNGPARVKQWREAAALYKVALQKEPGRDEAPEAAMNGALAYKQVGDYDQAIEMYTLFIKAYGNEETLNKLQKGDGTKPPEPKKYEDRLKYLKLADDTLAASYVLFFNYRTAAETYDTISRNQRFTQDDRRKAARNAVLLYANIGDKDKMVSSRGTFMGLNPPTEQKADIDYLVASADLKTWDEKGSDDGVNRTARTRAIGSMEGYFNANKNTPQAAGYTVQAAYNVAKMMRAGRDGKAGDWCKSTIQAFERYKTSAPQKNGRSEALGSLQADMAAECGFNAVDDKIKADFDYETGHHRYVGVVDAVKKKFEEDVKRAGDVYFKELQDVINRYESRAWSVAAVARQGSLYDSCRTGLYNAAPPGLKLYTDKEEKLLKLAETSDREDLQEQADALRTNRRVTWRDSRNRMLDDADAPMIKFYASAVVWSRAWKVRNSAVDNAIRRLAFFTDILGDAKMRALTQGIIDPETKRPFEYSDGVFLRSRPGALPPTEGNPVPNPLPVIP